MKNLLPWNMPGEEFPEWSADLPWEIVRGDGLGDFSNLETLEVLRVSQ